MKKLPAVCIEESIIRIDEFSLLAADGKKLAYVK